jgi:hypothetical protein
VSPPLTPINAPRQPEPLLTCQLQMWNARPLLPVPDSPGASLTRHREAEVIALFVREWFERCAGRPRPGSLTNSSAG